MELNEKAGLAGREELLGRVEVVVNARGLAGSSEEVYSSVSDSCGPKRRDVLRAAEGGLTGVEVLTRGLEEAAAAASAAF